MFAFTWIQRGKVYYFTIMVVVIIETLILALMEYLIPSPTPTVLVNTSKVLTTCYSMEVDSIALKIVYSYRKLNFSWFNCHCVQHYEDLLGINKD